VNGGLPGVLDRLCHRYPSLLVDTIAEHEPGKRMVAVKNVSVNEEFFTGHFPGKPLMPAVLMIEALTQVATILLLDPSTPGSPAAPDSRSLRAGRVELRGVDNAKFRKHVVPGDRLKLEVTLGAVRGTIVRAAATAQVDGQTVAEAELVLVLTPAADIDPQARVHAGAVIGDGTTVGAFAVIGPQVRIGRNCKIGASSVIDGNTTIGDGTEVFPFASIGLPPQDLKYKGEDTRLIIGERNIFREFVTIHRGTAGGGGETTIGDRNLFMNYVHVAHDCHVGNETIFGPHATLGGHVSVANYVNVSAGSAVHQFCRVGPYAFIGGYSVVTKDALPYGRTVGSRPARVFGLNLIGLRRRGFSDDTLRKLRAAYRYLTQSKLNTTQALAKIEQDPALSCPEVDNLVQFIRTASRGVILRRGGKRADEAAED
jgi:UDP-N-acetylglucosamine acyltransferase